MRIAIVGAGAVGGYFGGLLAQAGNHVTLIARGIHLEAIRSKGLEVRSHWSNFTISVVPSVILPAAPPPPEDHGRANGDYGPAHSERQRNHN